MRLPTSHGFHHSKTRTCHVASHGGKQRYWLGHTGRCYTRDTYDYSQSVYPRPQVAAPATAATKEEAPSPPQLGIIMSRTMRRHDEAAASKDIAGDAGENVAPAKQLKTTPVASAPIN